VRSIAWVTRMNAVHLPAKSLRSGTRCGRFHSEIHRYHELDPLESQSLSFWPLQDSFEMSPDRYWVRTDPRHDHVFTSPALLSQSPELKLRDFYQNNFRSKPRHPPQPRAYGFNPAIPAFCGLGMERTGFAYIQHERIDFHLNTFSPQFSSRLGFRTTYSEHAYRKRYTQIRNTLEHSHRVSQCRHWLTKFYTNTRALNTIYSYFHQVCAATFRSEVYRHLAKFTKSKYRQAGQAGQLLLCWSMMITALDDKKVSVPQITTAANQIWQTYSDVFDHF
jgi:hypothetical protein